MAIQNYSSNYMNRCSIIDYRVIGCNIRPERGDESFYRISKIIYHQGESTRVLSEKRYIAWLVKLIEKIGNLKIAMSVLITLYQVIIISNRVVANNMTVRYMTLAHMPFSPLPL